MQKFIKLVLDTRGADVTLSTSIDAYGEFMSVPFMDILKEITSQVVTEARNRDNVPVDKEDYWKLELERRKQEGEFIPAINEESSSNY